MRNIIVILFLFVCSCVFGQTQNLYFFGQNQSSAITGEIALRASNTASTTGTTLTLTKPTGTAEGDLMIVFTGLGENVAQTRPSGWQVLFTPPVSFTMTQLGYYKVATASEPSSYNFTTAASQDCVGVISTFYSTAGYGEWFMGEDNGNVESSSNTVSTGNVTSVDNSILISTFSIDGAISTVLTPPSDMTLIDGLGITGITIYTYYQLTNFETLNKTIVWDNPDEIIGTSNIFYLIL